jgi:hypothetical protein
MKRSPTGVGTYPARLTCHHLPRRDTTVENDQTADGVSPVTGVPNIFSVIPDDCTPALRIPRE